MPQPDGEPRRLVDILPTLSVAEQKTLDTLSICAQEGAPVEMLSQIGRVPGDQLTQTLESLTAKGLLSWADEAHLGCTLPPDIREQLNSLDLIASLPFSPESDT